jgi:hypothetical protein
MAQKSNVKTNNSPKEKDPAENVLMQIQVRLIWYKIVRNKTFNFRRQNTYMSFIRNSFLTAILKKIPTL